VPRAVGSTDALMATLAVGPPLDEAHAIGRMVLVPSSFYPKEAKKLDQCSGFIGKIMAKAKVCSYKCMHISPTFTLTLIGPYHIT
jgi:hypothetical protein